MVGDSNVYESLVRFFNCPKIGEVENLLGFDSFRCQNNKNLKMDDFLQKLKKVVGIVLNGPTISRSDCRKAGPYQLPYNNYYLLTGCKGRTVQY